MSDKKNSPIRETTQEARHLACELIATNQFGALAVFSPTTGYPSVTRVAYMPDLDNFPILLISRLSAHSKAISADTRSSILIGNSGKGDPLTHPRLSIECDAQEITRSHRRFSYLRSRYLRFNPKAKLYIDFGDFYFIKLQPKTASLNGGFGKAFCLNRDDLSGNQNFIDDAEDIFVRKVAAKSKYSEENILHTFIEKSTLLNKKTPKLLGVTNTGLIFKHLKNKLYLSKTIDESSWKILSLELT